MLRVECQLKTHSQGHLVDLEVVETSEIASIYKKIYIYN